MKLLIGLLAMLLPLLSVAQSPPVRPLSVGDTVPDVFIEGIYKPLTQEIGSASLSEYNDRLIIFDFWATWCGPCIAGMPKLDSLQRFYGNKIKIIPVSRENEKIVANFFAKRPNLSLTSVINDEKLNSIFPNRTIPHAVILNRSHKVVAITNSAFINHKVIDSILDDKQVNLKKKLDLIGYDRRKPYTVGGNANLKSENILFSSLVTKRVDGIGSSFIKVYHSDEEIGFHYSNLSVIQLFLYAMQKPLRYVYNRVFLENIRDASLYIPMAKTEEEVAEWELRNLFSYEIIAPLLSDTARYPIMLRDLNKGFGDLYNVQASWEKRTVPCLVLNTISEPCAVAQRFRTNPAKINADQPVPENVSLAKFTSTVETMCRMPLEISDVLKTKTQFQLTPDIRLTEDPALALEKVNKILSAQGLEFRIANRAVEVLVLKETH